ncbi:hypothetical protein EHE19_018615 [Ruminiclostridium herbifermentans]|uniref:Uncharacterized protein n=1 Tax=Ruminiclostridium herbifermentans TaxID=2488810 RepID=A0A4U7JEF8_9FIRM|nr:hypothetical protein [Ruminiclostridium herbifermentans]QNU66819.1 hypothetical protein EHE19_018615 [Ruminiclostridium herbifermentans]
MGKIIKILGLSLLDAAIIIIMLIFILRLKLPITGMYIVFGITAIVFPLMLLLIYNSFCERETLIFVPLSLVLASLYSLGISVYSYYGNSSFSNMFNELMYFMYFLPSIIYCGMGWIFFSIILRVSKNSRR